MSKVAQIYDIYRTKRGELVSLVPWAVYAFTSLGEISRLLSQKARSTVRPSTARVYTVYVETADAILLTQYVVSTLLNTGVMVAAVTFRQPEKKSL